jgi:O-antigen/teichoic acid export membrane protein
MQRLKTLIQEPFYRNSVSIVANSFFATFYGLVFWIIAAHVAPADVIGLAVATISTAGFLASLSRLGMDDVLVRFLPGSKSRSALYSSVLAITLFMALCLTAAFLLLCNYLSPSLSYLQGGWYLILFAMYMAIYSIFTTQNTTLLAIRRADLSLIQNTLQGLRIPLILLLGSFGVAGILFSFNLSFLAALSMGLVFLMKNGFRIGAVDVKSVVNTLKGHFGYSAGNYVSVLFTIAPATLMPIIIMNTIGAEEVAYYYIAYSIAGLLFIIPNAVSMSLFIEGSHDMPMRDYTSKSIKLILFVVVPLVLLLYFFGDQLLLLFNKEYSEQSIGLLKLFVIASVFSTVTSVYASIRRVEKNVKSLNKVSATTSLLIIGLGYVFLTTYGLTGLGYAWILANAAVSAVLLAVLIKEGKLFRAQNR